MMKKKTLITMIALVFIITLMGCGKSMKKYAGDYIGTSGAFLQLIDDGTCVYTDNGMLSLGMGAGAGTWKIDEDEIIVHVDVLDCDIYADISDYEGGLMFVSDDFMWNDEYFEKKEK